VHDAASRTDVGTWFVSVLVALLGVVSSMWQLKTSSQATGMLTHHLPQHQCGWLVEHASCPIQLSPFSSRGTVPRYLASKYPCILSALQ
jgi:hypothetical protein